MVESWIHFLQTWIATDTVILSALAAWLATFTIGEAGGIFILTYAMSDTIDLNVALVFVFLGSFSADMFWYGVTVSTLRPWIDRRFPQKTASARSSLTIPLISYAKTRPYLVLLIIKFLMGLRLILTITIASRRDIPFSKYLICNVIANILFVGVLFGISYFVHESVSDALDVKNNIFHALTLVVIIVVGSQLVFRILERLLSVFLARYRNNHTPHT